MSDDKMNKQSIILNYNPNINNDSAYSYEQSANQLLEIKAGAEVALYKAYLQRKAVVIPEDENISVILNSAYNSLNLNQANKPFDNDEITDILKNLTSSLDITLPKGTYTKSEFVNAFSLQVDLAIQNNSVDTFTSSNINTTTLPYEYNGRINQDGSVFMGMTNDYQVKPLEHRDPFANTDENTLHNVIKSSNGLTNLEFTPNTNVSAGATSTFLAMENTILPYAYTNNSNLQNQNTDQSILYFDIQSPIVESSQGVTQCCMMNTNMTSNIWSTANTIHIDSDSNFPTCLFGLEIESEVSSSNVVSDTLKIFHNEILQQDQFSSPLGQSRDAYVEEVFTKCDHSLLKNYTMVKSTQLMLQQPITMPELQNDRFIKLGLRIYAVRNKTVNYVNPYSYGKDYYYQVIGTNTYSANPILSGASSEVIFDSRDLGIKLPQRIVDAGLLTNCVTSDRHAGSRGTLGLQPYFVFKDCPAGYNLRNITGSCNGLYARQNNYSGGRANVLNSYSYNFPVRSTIKNILGAGTTVLSGTGQVLNSVYLPGLYPTYMEQAAGIMNLFGDNIRYNIEIPSLPIKTFNTTSTIDFNLGNERTIIYGTGVFLTGNLTEINNTFVNINIEPNNLKFISLNNNKSIKLNNIKVQIRRAGTNQEATEITDCSIELMIKNPQ
tara:strand:+ start:3035 stop:5026 length:1992 start_codon:yes stop_codon:yes gene_type:complete